MSLLLFIVAIVISFIAVRIGAIAFQITGLSWSLAKFQALSCFSGTGFTTKEAELITTHPKRRKIASILMVFGNAGLVTLIATFANSLRPDPIKLDFKIPFLGSVLPPILLQVVNLLIITVALYGIYKFFTYSSLSMKLNEKIRNRIVDKDIIRPVSFEELAITVGGYGIMKFTLRQNNPMFDKTLSKSELRKSDITVLAIERGTEVIPNPSPETRLSLNDNIICFGKLENLRIKLQTANEI